MKRKTGDYQTLGSIQFFIPDALPPNNPPLQLSPELVDLHGNTMMNLGKLNEMSHRLPDIKRFIKAYVIKEALLSSAIENIHTTIIDIFTQPLTQSQPSKETELVINYITATDTALHMLEQEHLPLSNRILLQAHEQLMTQEQTINTDAGKYRTHAVRVGNLVPPPAPAIPQLMGDLEHFINDATLPPLIKAGLVHVQFETIHPFSDGNGRVGRLLIVLMLLESKLLNQPILYPSYFFKKYRFEYYQALDRVRTEGDFEGWIRYFLNAINESCINAHQRAIAIEHLERQLRSEIATSPLFSKIRELADQALTILFQSPIITINEMADRLEKSYTCAQNSIDRLVQAGILEPISAAKRNKLFRFTSYLAILEQD